MEEEPRWASHKRKTEKRGICGRNLQLVYVAPINRIFFRKMKTEWASYSPNGNLTINTLTKYLPQNLIEYIIHHEITQSKERKHNKNFWNTIARKQ